MFILTDKKRSKGIILFRGLAIFQSVLGILMLVTAGLATNNSNGHGYTDYGVPYYIGGFIVGFLVGFARTTFLILGTRASRR